MKTIRFDQREKFLKTAFDKSKMINLWRGTVKSQLRGLDVKDLYDYYDFNYNIEERVIAIKNEILNGNFKAQSPLIYRIEKKLGICRQLLIPQPSDALVLQVLTENIYPKIRASQPSENAFYSRDKSEYVKSVPEVDEYEMMWGNQWKKMQTEIYRFSESKELIVSTDLTNYYDSIDLSTLRECILSMASESDEVLIDLIFRMVEELSWKPDYLPYKKHGLPTINIESIRLLGHSFLFEVDSVLKHKTRESFTRWMDDITFGIDSEDEAYNLLGGISDVLKSRGLALNLSKTNLYNATEFHYEFLVESNKYLDQIQKKEVLNTKELKELKNNFNAHLKDQKPKQWDKVTKRYLTQFSAHKVNIFQHIDSLYLKKPGIRMSLGRYFTNLGYSKKSAIAVESLFTKLRSYDDISLFILSNVLTEWSIPLNDGTKKYIETITSKIKDIQNPMHFYSLIWIRAKYSHPEELLNFILQYRNNWQKNAFLRRQVTSVLARLYLFDTIKVHRLLEDQVQSGVLDASSVANQILAFAKLEEIDKKLMSYLFPPKLYHYSISRFLVLCSVLNSSKIKNNSTIRNKIKEVIKDPYQKQWLFVTYNIS